MSHYGEYVDSADKFIRERVMKDTLTIECLVQAFQNVMEARAEHDKARDKYIDGGGYSWGYYGQSYLERVESASVELQTRLESYIDQRIEQKLGRGL